MAANSRSILSQRKILLILRNSLFRQSYNLGIAKYFHSTSYLEDITEEALPHGKNDENYVDEKLEKGKVYGYTDGQRDKSTEGLLYLGMIKLPEQLKETYKVFCRRYPKKSLTEDGHQIALHLRNRGRPTEQTWKKYKESKGKVEIQVSQFPIDGNKQTALGTVDDSVDDKAEVTDVVESASTSPDNLLLSNREVKKKTDAPKRAQYSVIRYGKREIAAFASSRIPACFGSTKRVLNEIAQRDPDYAPKTLLDFGSGTGTAIWAAHDVWGRSLREYQCIDVSEDANNACEFLLRGSIDPSTPLKIPGVYFRRFLPLSNKVTYDIVISAYTLSELPFRKQRQFALSNLWAKTNDFLVLIEPGNNEGFDIMLQARNYVTKGSKDTQDVFTGYIENDQETPQEEVEFVLQDDVDNGFVFAPCPHDTACARSEVEARDHPCNFEQKVELAFSQRNTTLKRWGYATERFSYLVLRKGERNPNDRAMPRLLEPPKRRRRHVLCNICNSNGNIEQYVFTRKKDPNMYKGIRHCVRWGDLLPVMDEKKPRKVITFENEIVVNKDD